MPSKHALLVDLMDVVGRLIKEQLKEVLMSFAVTGLGVFIAARMKSTQGFQGLMGLLVMPLFFLSGGMFPIDSAPAWMKTLMMIDPLTYGSTPFAM